MCFVDKNPEGDEEDADPLEEESDWEHRVVRNIVWWRHKGYAVETALYQPYDSPVRQSIERYQINTCLHTMIRASPNNVRKIITEDQVEDDDSSSDSSDTSSPSDTTVSDNDT